MSVSACFVRLSVPSSVLTLTQLRRAPTVAPAVRPAGVHLRVGDLLDAVGADGDDGPRVLGDGDAAVLALLDHVLAHPP